VAERMADSDCSRRARCAALLEPANGALTAAHGVRQGCLRVTAEHSHPREVAQRPRTLLECTNGDGHGIHSE
jgi:hypothetical protein